MNQDEKIILDHWKIEADVEMLSGENADAQNQLGHAILSVDGYQMFIRQKGKNGWMSIGGGFLGKHHIVKSLTRFYDRRYQRPEFSESDALRLEGFVELIGTFMDAHNATIDSSRRSRLGNNLFKQEVHQIIQNEKEKLTLEPSKKSKKGYLYLFSHTNGLTKIGFSSNPQRREKTLQAEDPRIHMLCARKGTLQQERRLHRIFSKKRIRGEWFDLTEQDKKRLIKWLGFKKQKNPLMARKKL